MKKQFLLLISMCITIMMQAQTATTPSGSGTSDNPYQIATLDNLYWLSQNSGEWSKYYVQTANIDASATATWDGGAGWAPMGYATNQTSFLAFMGSYNGAGHFIYGLTINRPTIGCVGFFGLLYGATVQNLGLVNVNITGGGEGTAALCGLSYFSTTTITECFVTGNVNGEKNVGGLVGMNEGAAIYRCFSEATVTCSAKKAGGLVGKNSGIVRNCYATGAVSCSSESNGQTGGLIGGNEALVENCYATGAVSGCTQVGGLIGKNTSENGTTASVDSCYASGAITVTGNLDYTCAGGLVGENYYSASINSCYATGTVAGTNISSSVGGLVGNNSQSSIKYCFSTGNASGSGCIGGLVGHNNSGSTISNCFSRGNATGLTNNVGGLVGRNAGSEITNSYSTGTAYSSGGCYGGILGSNEQGGSITYSFWDTQTSGLTGGCGYNESVFEATGKSTSEMKTKTTFSSAGWDFSTVWGISSTNNNGYPYMGSGSETGIELNKKDLLSIYPNPATDGIRMNGFEGVAAITLSDITGKLVLEKTITENEIVSVSSLPKGVYLITVKSNAGTVIRKIQKQ